MFVCLQVTPFHNNQFINGFTSHSFKPATSPLTVRHYSPRNRFVIVQWNNVANVRAVAVGIINPGKRAASHLSPHVNTLEVPQSSQHISITLTQGVISCSPTHVVCMTHSFVAMCVWKKQTKNIKHLFLLICNPRGEICYIIDRLNHMIIM